MQVFKPGTSSNLLSLPKNPTPSRATALLHLPYTLPQLLIQGAQLKNPFRPSPTVAPPTSHSCPASCFPFSCAITCSPPRLTPKDLPLAISNSITCWIPTIPPSWTYRICRHWWWTNLSLCQYRPFALSSKPLPAFPSIVSPKHSVGPPWTRH